MVLELALPLLEEAAGAPGRGKDRRPQPLTTRSHDAMNIDGYDEIIVSTLPAPGVAPGLRNDLPSKLKPLGVPITTVSGKGRRGARAARA